MLSRIKRPVLFLIILLAGFVSYSKSTTPDIRLTADRDYLPALMADLKTAQKTVTVVMYLTQMEDPERHTLVKGLLDELIACHARGLAVSVIAEQDRTRNDEDPIKSQGALKYLAKGGVKVFIDDPTTSTHSKVVVIDETLVHLGSSNWTYSAFMKNHECNLRICDPGLARQLLDLLSRQERKPF